MAANIRNTNLRFNLEKDLQRKAWEYLQTMDKQEFRSYSQVIALALVEYFDRYYRTQEVSYTTAGKIYLTGPGIPAANPMQMSAGTL